MNFDSLFKNKKVHTKENDYMNIFKAIKETKNKIDKTYDMFNLTDDMDLIDSYIYQINALNSHYDYLIKKVKETHLTKV